MTQAYNLSQLANNLNSAGQLDATDGLVNAVPIANGGTGASSAAAARTNLNVPTRTGGDASGTWSINISGNASTSTNATTAASCSGNSATATTAASCSGNSATATQLSTATGSAPSYGVRAWVNFDGTGADGTNQTIRGSGNVASVYKNAAGDYTVTFTTAMPNANYSVSGSAMRNAGGGPGGLSQIILAPLNSTTYSDAFKTTSVRICTIFNDTSGTPASPLSVSVQIVG